MRKLAAHPCYLIHSLQRFLSGDVPEQFLLLPDQPLILRLLRLAFLCSSRLKKQTLLLDCGWRGGHVMAGRLWGIDRLGLAYGLQMVWLGRDGYRLR